MKKDKLDELMEYGKINGPDFFQWVVPVKEFMEAFDLGARSHACPVCSKRTKPLIPYHFISEGGENVVGYQWGHIECEKKVGSGMPSTSLHIDENSEFNKLLKGLFE